MLWAVICIDQPNTTEARDELRKIHREHLDAHGAAIFFSGPLLSDDGATQIGSEFILAVASRAEAKAFIDTEPFNMNGVFAKIEIFRMRKGRFNPGMADGSMAVV